MHRSLLLLALTFFGCADIPKTSEESFRRTRLVRQPTGGTLVIGPEIPFTVRGAHGVTRFQALITPRKVTFYQTTSLAGLADAGTFETPRARMETFRKTGTSVGVTGTSVTVRFSPAYIDGFLRRVDAVAASP